MAITTVVLPYNCDYLGNVHCSIKIHFERSEIIKTHNKYFIQLNIHSWNKIIQHTQKNSNRIAHIEN